MEGGRDEFHLKKSDGRVELNLLLGGGFSDHLSSARLSSGTKMRTSPLIWADTSEPISFRLF